MNRTNKLSVIGIAVFTGVAIMGDAMLSIVLPIYWSDMGLTAVWQVGVLLSINRFVRLPINPLVGFFYRHYSLRLGISIAMGLAIVSTFSYGIFSQFSILVMMRIVWGIAWSLLRLGGFLSIIQLTSKTDRGQFIGLYNGVWGIGSLIGMLVGGLLIAETSIRFITTLFGLIGCVTFPFVPFLTPSGKKEPTVQKTTTDQQKPLLALDQFVLTLSTSMVMGLLIFGVFSNTLSARIDQSYQDNWTFMSFAFTSTAIAGIIQAVRWGWAPFLAPFIGKYLDHTKHKQQALICFLLSLSALFALIGSINQISFVIVLLLLFQFVSTGFVTTTDTIASDLAEKGDSIKVITFHTIMVDTGAALGPLLAFGLLEYFPLRVVYLIASILLFVLAIGWISWLRKKQNDPFAFSVRK
ncbi:MFS family permease [Natronobacillus azotifigens]|uniref:MFS transporter n=1 Tax=Natronobacillus azotifigens TaxID=472978 RepID=A0A9J6RBQ9_9BACI|nr:MFS transporter [Natronobacillus azotifigens]MCZ0702983.1 MFS transporter [Natronobacillus azotifigens]